MRARRSSTRLPMRRPSLLALRSAAPLHLDPRSRSRRLVAVFGCGGTASRRRGFIELLEGWRCVRRAGAAMASRAARRGRPRSGAAVQKAGRGLSRLSVPSLKAGAACASPALRGRWGKAPQSSVKLRSPWGLRTGRHGSVHVARRVKNGFYCAFARRPFRFLVCARREAYARAVLTIWLARPLCKKPGDCHKAPRESA